MLTLQKLDIYFRFRGDVDFWQRSGSPGPITDDDWETLEDLVQDAHLCVPGLAAPEFVAGFEARLHSAFDCDQARARFLDDAQSRAWVRACVQEMR